MVVQGSITTSQLLDLNQSSGFSLSPCVCIWVVRVGFLPLLLIMSQPTNQQLCFTLTVQMHFAVPHSFLLSFHNFFLIFHSFIHFPLSAFHDTIPLIPFPSDYFFSAFFFSVCFSQFCSFLISSVTFSNLSPSPSLLFFSVLFLLLVSFCSLKTNHVSPLGNTNPLRSQGGAPDNGALSQL